MYCPVRYWHIIIAVSKCCVLSLTYIKRSVTRQHVGCDNQPHVTSDGTMHIVSPCIGHKSYKFYSTFKRHFNVLLSLALGCRQDNKEPGA